MAVVVDGQFPEELLCDPQSQSLLFVTGSRVKDLTNSLPSIAMLPHFLFQAIYASPNARPFTVVSLRGSNCGVASERMQSVCVSPVDVIFRWKQLPTW